MHVHAARDEDGLRELLDALQRPLDTVEDAVQDAGSQLQRQRLA